MNLGGNLYMGFMDKIKKASSDFAQQAQDTVSNT